MIDYQSGVVAFGYPVSSVDNWWGPWSGSNPWPYVAKRILAEKCYPFRGAYLILTRPRVYLRVIT